MQSNILAAWLATTVSLALAATPAIFTPGSTTPLIVAYNGQTALNGAVIAQTAVTNQPQTATQTKLNGTSYAIMMIDIDIPTNAPPATSTLLHWMQTGLTPATAATTLNSTSGSVFLLQNSSNTAPFAAYLPPSPPARVPLSHMYVQILVDTSAAPQTAIQSLRTAAANRGGFNALQTLTAAGLQNKVVAGNFYNVTNPGPAAATNTTTTASNSTTTGSARPTATRAGAPAVVAQSFAAGAVFFVGLLVLV